MSAGAVSTTGMSKDILAPLTSDLATAAHRDAMKHIAQGIPDPEEFARCMPLRLAAMLLTASPSGAAARVVEPYAEELRPHGLVEAGTNQRMLTAFGHKVRLALLAEDA